MNQDKKKVIIVISIISVMLVTLLIFLSIIWRDGWFNGGYSRDSSTDQVGSLKVNASNISKYTAVSTEEIDSKIVDKYTSEVIELLSSYNYSNIYNKLNKDFIEDNNLSEYNIEAYLKDNGLVGDLVTVEKITRYIDGDNIYVYRLKVVVDYNVKFVNIIETKPYEYTINFEQDTIPIIGTSSYSATVDNILFEISIAKKQEKAIIFEVKVTNTGDDLVKFDFTSVNSVALAINDGGFIKQPSSILEKDMDYSLNKDSYFIKRFYFPINMQYQKDINSLSFYNVKIGNSEKNIYVKL